MTMSPALMKELHDLFGDRLQERARLSNYTTARVGGPADALIIVQSLQELEQGVMTLWRHQVNFHLIGAGSNVLVSDNGVNGVVVLNRARNVKIDTHGPEPAVWAESGANLGSIARQVALRGFSGLEWAGTVPGTLGGAIYGNAGAFGGDMAGNLILAEILHYLDGRKTWTAADMAYGYRTSILKRTPEQAVILAARLKLSVSTPEKVQAVMAEYSDKRRKSQPPGASLGSMFKNPPGDHAGRLIEAAGMKGKRVGGAEVSPVHANFIVNNEHATAADIWTLMQIVHKAVKQHSGISLEPEIETLGDFPALDSSDHPVSRKND